MKCPNCGKEMRKVGDYDYKCDCMPDDITMSLAQRTLSKRR